MKQDSRNESQEILKRTKFGLVKQQNHKAIRIPISPFKLENIYPKQTLTGNNWP